jgi:hypothetical protein
MYSPQRRGCGLGKQTSKEDISGVTALYCSESSSRVLPRTTTTEASDGSTKSNRVKRQKRNSEKERGKVRGEGI